MKNNYRLLTLLLFLVSPAINAFQLIPITADLTPSGPGSISNFKVVNNGQDIVALQVSMHHRSTTPDGLEVNSPADELFIVYPSQIILEPGNEQIIRVQWNGDPQVDREKPFRIIAEQLPIDFSQDENETGGLKIMFRYIGSVYVGTRSMQPDIFVENLKRQGDSLVMDIRNNGKAHAILQNMTLVITNKSGRELARISGEPLEGISGENILAGEKRSISIPAPADLTEVEIEANVAFQKL
jgi:fimbrial chaperone protein